MAFFDSYLGAYLVQSFVHSWLAFFLVEAALRVWDVDAPRARFHFRLAILVLPIAMYPAFQALSPERGDFYFRQDAALFVAHHWLLLELPGGLPLGVVGLGFFLIGTTSLVIVQELVPIGRDMVAKNRAQPADDVSARDGTEAGGCSIATAVEIVGEHAASLTLSAPSVELLPDDAPIILTTGNRPSRIVVSCGLLAMLDEAQLRVALAHEMAHVLRRSTVLTVIIFVVRLVTFFNPVTLLVFRQLVQDDEQICDDITVQVTREPMRLAEVLRMFHIGESASTSAREAIEDRSHNLLIRDRVARLEAGSAGIESRFPWGAFFLTMVAVVGLSYFVV